MTDALQTINDLLEDNWTAANTDLITPTVSKVYDKKRVGGLDNIKTLIATYHPAPSSETPLGFGYNHVDLTEKVTVDIRTSESSAHALKARDETLRILKANRKTTTGYDVLIVNSYNDLSNATIKVWRWVVEITLVVYGQAV